MNNEAREWKHEQAPDIVELSFINVALTVLQDGAINIPAHFELTDTTNHDHHRWAHRRVPVSRTSGFHIQWPRVPNLHLREVRGEREGERLGRSTPQYAYGNNRARNDKAQPYSMPIILTLHIPSLSPLEQMYMLDNNHRARKTVLGDPAR